MINFSRITAIEAREYPLLWETVKAELSLDDEQTALVISLVVGICPDCYGASRECQCWNDE